MIFFFFFDVFKKTKFLKPKSKREKKRCCCLGLGFKEQNRRICGNRGEKTKVQEQEEAKP